MSDIELFTFEPEYYIEFDSVNNEYVLVTIREDEDYDDGTVARFTQSISDFDNTYAYNSDYFTRSLYRDAFEEQKVPDDVIQSVEIYQTPIIIFILSIRIILDQNYTFRPEQMLQLLDYIRPNITDCVQTNAHLIDQDHLVRVFPHLAGEDTLYYNYYCFGANEDEIERCVDQELQLDDNIYQYVQFIRVDLEPS
jgi:hypothetical protein